MQRHRIQVVHQGAKTLLEALAIEFEVVRRLCHHRRLLGHHTQQTELGTNTCQVLPQVVVQRLRQLGTLLLLCC
ncbi:hypothetical protein D3C76_1018950 [compost metagenome]